MLLLGRVHGVVVGMEHRLLRRIGARAAEHITKGEDLEALRTGGTGTSARQDLRRERVPHGMKLEVEAHRAARVAGGLVSKGCAKTNVRPAGPAASASGNALGAGGGK